MKIDSNYKIEMIKVSSINPHPKNEIIYNSKRGKEDYELKNSIILNGLLEPIVVDRKSHQIISGHRRFLCVKELKWKKVPVRFIDIDYDIIKLIHFNKYREKTVEEKRNEEREMKNYLKSLTPKKRKSILQGIPMREYISNEVGLSFNSSSKLNFIEENDPNVLQDIYLGKLSLTEGYKTVKSRVEKKDYNLEYSIIDIKGRIKKISNTTTKQQWLNMIDEIYNQN